MARHFAEQTNFAAGEVAEEFWHRTDAEMPQAAARLLRNFQVTHNGSVKTRPGFSARTLWITPMTAGASEPNFRVFPFTANVGEIIGAPIFGLSTDQRAQDFGLILRKKDTNEIEIVKFDPQEPNPASSLASPLATTIAADDTSVISRTGGTMNAVQALTSMFFVSNLFHPHQFIEDAIASQTSGEVNKIQFYKDAKGIVAIDAAGLATFADGTGPTGLIEPKDEFALPANAPNAGIVRVAGKEYPIVAFPGPGQVQLSMWTGGPVANLTVQRRWPNHFTSESSLNIDDGMGVGNDDSDSFVSFFRPTVVAFFGSRLWLASSLPIITEVVGDEVIAYPNRLWVSRDGDAFTIQPSDRYALGVTPATAPIQVDLMIDDGDRFQWAKSADKLYLGGTRATYVMVSGTGNASISGAALVGVQKINSIGSAVRVPPVTRNGKPVYVTRDGASIVGTRFDFQSESFATDDAARFARHLTAGVTRLSLRPPNPQDAIERLYCVKEDGSIVQAAFTDLQESPAWSRIALPQGLIADDAVMLEGRTFFVVRRTSDDKHAIVRFNDDADAEVEGYALDFFHAAVVQSGGTPTPLWKTTDDFFYGKSAYVIVQQTVDGPWAALGFVNVQPAGPNAGKFALNDVSFGMTVLGVRIGFALDNALVPMTRFADDELGPSTNRRSRVLQTLARVRNTRNVAIDGHGKLSNILPAGPGGLVEKLAQSTVVRELHLGWAFDRTVTISAPAPYRAEILNVTQEIHV